VSGPSGLPVLPGACVTCETWCSRQHSPARKQAAGGCRGLAEGLPATLGTCASSSARSWHSGRYSLPSHPSCSAPQDLPQQQLPKCRATLGRPGRGGARGARLHAAAGAVLDEHGGAVRHGQRLHGAGRGRAPAHVGRLQHGGMLLVQAARQNAGLRLGALRLAPRALRTRAEPRACARSALPRPVLCSKMVNRAGRHLGCSLARPFWSASLVQQSLKTEEAAETVCRSVHCMSWLLFRTGGPACSPSGPQELNLLGGPHAAPGTGQVPAQCPMQLDRTQRVEKRAAPRPLG